MSTTTNKRSRAREAALQLLFQHDLNPTVGREEITRFASDQLGEADLVSLALSLYGRTREDLANIDARLGQAAENWRLSRMAVIDRNILRLGACEILHDRDTPPAVVLDEAIELARKFGSADSPGFVNGVLDRLYREWQTEQQRLAEPAPSPEPPPAPELAPAD